MQQDGKDLYLNHNQSQQAWYVWHLKQSNEISTAEKKKAITRFKLENKTKRYHAICNKLAGKQVQACRW